MPRKTKKQLAAEVRAAAQPVANGHSTELIPEAPADVQTYDQVVEEDVDWLWEGWIPYGSVTLVTGPSRCGKSTLLTRICAHVCGGPAFDRKGTGLAGRAQWWSIEEVAARQILPRLRVAEVPRGRVYRGGHDRSGSEVWRLALPTHLARLKEEVVRLRLRLLVIDPITSYLADGVDPHLAGSVRPILEGLESVAHQTGVAVIGTLHDRKDATGSALDHVSGAAAWTQVPRTILRVGYDPQKPSQRVLAVAKTLVGIGPSSILYQIDNCDGVGRWTTTGSSALSADDLSSVGGRRGERDAQRDAQLFLRHELGSGPVPTKELQRLAQDAGLSWKGAVYDAKETLGITAHRVPTVAGWHYEWRPPEGGFKD
jgi:RecA-family ATPase